MTTTPPAIGRPAPPRRLLAVVLLIALLVRLGAALLLGDRVEVISGAADQYSYDVLAQRVLAGHGFSFPTGWYPYSAADEPTAHWSFLYTLYLSGVYALFGHHPFVARLIQLALSIVSLWLTYRLGRHLFNEWVGVAAAALAACYAYLIFFNVALMTQSFYILTLFASLLLALKLAERPTWRGWVGLGLALGAGALLRQTLLLFAPFLLGWILWAQRRRLPWRGALAAAAIAALFVLPWTARNYLVYDDFLLLNSNGGFWFYAANHPDQGTDFDPTFVPHIPAELAGQPEPAIDRALYRAALDFVVADPARFVRLSVSRLNDYFWLLPSEDSSLVSNLARIFSFGLYLPFMLGGLYLSRRCWRRCLPLYLYLAFDASLHLISWAAPRYRLPSDALLMIFAGAAVVALARQLVPARLAPRLRVEADPRP